MPGEYLKNLAGFKLSDAQMSNICCPRLELAEHITLKVSQAGAVIGVGLVGPAMSAYRGKTDLQSMSDSAFTCGHKGVLIGAALGAVVSAAMLAKIDKQGAWDRCYRLRFNRKQVFVDRMSWVGAVVGAGAAGVMGSEACRGALFGFTGGCVMAGLLNTVL